MLVRAEPPPDARACCGYCCVCASTAVMLPLHRRRLLLLCRQATRQRRGRLLRRLLCRLLRRLLCRLLRRLLRRLWLLRSRLRRTGFERCDLREHATQCARAVRCMRDERVREAGHAKRAASVNIPRGRATLGQRRARGDMTSGAAPPLAPRGVNSMATA